MNMKEQVAHLMREYCARDNDEDLHLTTPDLCSIAYEYSGTTDCEGCSLDTATIEPMVLHIQEFKP